MSSDGAHLGVSVNRSLDTILGDKPSPSKKEGMSAQEMREYLENASDSPRESGVEGYEDTARLVAKRILVFLTANSKYQYLQADDKWDFSNLNDATSGKIVSLGLSGVLELAKVEITGLGLTGFQFGWAVNAAKYALGAPPVSNPALLTLTVD